jgi:L-fuconolactonase
MMQPEIVLEPELPIIDPHHHLWDHTTRPAAPPAHDFDRAIADSRLYLLPQLLGDLNSGHNVLGTVFIECGSMYRADGPSGHADLMLGGAVGEVLDAHIVAGGGRFKGIRHSVSHDADSGVLGPLSRRAPGVFKEKTFREGFAELSRFGLSFDAWLLEPQLPELIELARYFPDTTIVLDHVGTPLGIASYEGRREERFPIWAGQIGELAKLENVVVKLGGLAMCFPHFPSFMSDPPAPSEQLAEEWRPYIETCIQAFGPKRCMFESNFPVDIGSCDYRTLWNAFKVLAKGYSAEEKTAMFSGTAKRVYRLDL